MVIIKCNAYMEETLRRRLEINIHDQAADGVIVLPPFCELLNEVPADEEIQIAHQDARVAELEEELARVMFYISEQKSCETCKYENPDIKFCTADCGACIGYGNCICGSCFDGSKWEWKYANGNECAAAPGSDR